MSFVAELRRRNVIRMAGLYLIGAWLLVQVAGTVLPMFGAPDWLPRKVVILAALGFVPALVFAWIFELTPEGLKRDEQVPLEHSIAPQTARRMDRMIITVLTLALVYFGVDKFVLAPAREAAKAIVQQQTTRPPAPEVSRKSIAVLPFTDLSPGHDQEYFSDGMAEEILDALAQVQDLKVAGRMSSFYFKGKNEKLQTIGEALGVAHVLEGSVRKQGDQVRITAQLVQTRDGFHVWSESYDGDMKDVFQLQERIARAITDKLKVILLGEQKSRLSIVGTDNADAYEPFLLGRYFLSRRAGLVNLQSAETAFKAALVADPEYADAWAGLAQTYALIPEYSSSDPAGKGQFLDTSQQALDAAARALRLDPDSSRALSARAYVRCLYQFDWAGAEADYLASIGHDPRDPNAHQWYGELLLYQRRWPEADAQFDAAIALDPLAPVIHLMKGISSWYQGNTEAALVEIQESHRLSPDFYNPTINLVSVLVDARRFDQARAVAGELPVGTREIALIWIDGAQDPSKSDAAAQQIMARGPGSVLGKPVLLAMLGKNDLALIELERLFAQRDPYRVFIYAIKPFGPLRQDPRFQALLKQIGLPTAKSRR